VLTLPKKRPFPYHGNGVKGIVKCRIAKIK
jgi:hypothetical protein